MRLDFGSPKLVQGARAAGFAAMVPPPAELGRPVFAGVGTLPVNLGESVTGVGSARPVSSCEAEAHGRAKPGLVSLPERAHWFGVKLSSAVEVRVTVTEAAREVG
jgi:hypothetical protein